MAVERGWSPKPSLRQWSRVAALVLVVGACAFAAVSVGLLQHIVDDARATYGREIPYLLDRNRNAIKVERLGSYIRSLAATGDPRTRRRLLLQAETLGQTFVFDRDARLTAGTGRVVSIARRLASPAVAADEAARLGADGVRVIDELTDYLTTDAALRADRTATGIQETAERIRNAWLAALAVLAGFAALVAWGFARHVLRPIATAVRGLQAIGDGASASAAVALPRERFLELDMIARAVESYARFSAELSARNASLLELSETDGLTGLANRRAFDRLLGEALRARAAVGEGVVLLLVDVDHFKRLNDRFGHAVGDRCLRQIGLTLETFCGSGAMDAARYGGEEFAVIMRGASAAEAMEAAERLRAAVERTRTDIGSAARVVSMTVSVGVADAADLGAPLPEDLVRAADAALYEAKRAGRNAVSRFAPSGGDVVRLAPRSAA